MTWPRLRPAFGLALACIACALIACGGDARVSAPVPAPPAAPRLAVYVGTYTGGGSRGIYRFELDPASGAWTDPVLAGESENPSFLALHPGGRFLYASNRGDGSLAVFEIDAASGALAPAGHVAAGGRAPRHFALDPSGRWLLAANQDSDSITVFRVDAVTGRPEPVGRPIAISKPVCVLFAPAPR
jgi:6-phosphogluconolactonase (cycloisomerase 2 family)